MSGECAGAWCVRAFAESTEDAIEHGLAWVDREPPQAAQLAAGEVLVAVRSASVSLIDVLMQSGRYHHRPQLPFTPGMEYAGIVVATGRGVDPVRLRPGDRVMNDFMHTGPRSDSAWQAQGGWATHAVAPQSALLRIPAGMSFDSACNLLLNYETAYHALITRADLRAGETVLVNGASGAAGMAAIQVARLLGANVIAAGRSDHKLTIAREAGATNTVNVSARQDDGGVPRFRDELKALTGGRGTDVVFDTVGGAISLECLRSLRFGGRHVIVGWAATPDVSQGGGRGGTANANQLPTNIIQLKGLTVLASPMIIAAQRDPEIRAARLDVVLQWAERGLISPHVSHRFSLADARAAMRARVDGEVTGGCVLGSGLARSR